MDFETYMRFLLALVLVLALIWLVAWGLRRLGIGGGLLPKTAQRRLGIVEVAPLDAKRRLVLVRRDGVEHLLLLGMTHDLVIETAIARNEPGSETATPAEPTSRTEPAERISDQ